MYEPCRTMSLEMVFMSQVGPPPLITWMPCPAVFDSSMPSKMKPWTKSSRNPFPGDPSGLAQLNFAARGPSTERIDPGNAVPPLKFEMKAPAHP